MSDLKCDRCDAKPISYGTQQGDFCWHRGAKRTLTEPFISGNQWQFGCQGTFQPNGIEGRLEREKENK